MSPTNSIPLAKHEVFVNEIEFTSLPAGQAGKEEVSLFGFLQDCGKFFETQYIITRKDLQILLSQNSAGIEILWHIERLFAAPHAAPASLNLVDLFGTTQVFDACEIKLDVPFYQDEQGNLMPCQSHDLYFVEEVTPLNRNGEARGLKAERNSAGLPTGQAGN